MSAESNKEDSERIKAIKVLVKACKRPVPETLFGAMVIRGTSAEDAETILSQWDANGYAELGDSSQWGNAPKLKKDDDE